VELLFAGVPLRRDVRLGIAEHDEHLVAIRDVLPDKIVPRHMRMKNALEALHGIQLKWQMIGVQAAFPIRAQHSQWAAADEVVQNLDANFFEM
jgi:hypothetical protein